MKEAKLKKYRFSRLLQRKYLFYQQTQLQNTKFHILFTQK